MALAGADLADTSSAHLPAAKSIISTAYTALLRPRRLRAAAIFCETSRSGRRVDISRSSGKGGRGGVLGQPGELATDARTRRQQAGMTGGDHVDEKLLSKSLLGR